jgi:hypothetical protein
MHESCEVKGHMLVELQQHIDKKRQEQQLLVREIQYYRLDEDKSKSQETTVVTHAYTLELPCMLLIKSMTDINCSVCVSV